MNETKPEVKKKPSPLDLMPQEKADYKLLLDAFGMSVMNQHIRVTLMSGTYKHRRAAFLCVTTMPPGAKHEHILPVAMLLRPVDLDKHIRDYNMDPPQPCDCEPGAHPKKPTRKKFRKPA